MKTSEDLGTVIRLDLRSGAAELDTAKALRASVARQLGRAGLPEPDDPLFLVVDTPAGLTDHQRQYELLTAYRAVGEVRILVLLVGSAPGSYAGEDEAFQPDRRLVRPAVLRASGTALLWAGDLRSARTALEQPEPDQEALAVLVDVLSVPDVYRKVLDGLGALPDAVAAPGVRLLEQDLPREVRDRAWRDALLRFAGRGHRTRPDLLATASSGADLPEPLRSLVAGRGGRDQQHREPGGVGGQHVRRLRTSPRLRRGRARRLRSPCRAGVGLPAGRAFEATSTRRTRRSASTGTSSARPCAAAAPVRRRPPRRRPGF